MSCRNPSSSSIPVIVDLTSESPTPQKPNQPTDHVIDLTADSPISLSTRHSDSSAPVFTIPDSPVSTRSNLTILPSRSSRIQSGSHSSLTSSSNTSRTSSIFSGQSVGSSSRGNHDSGVASSSHTKTNTRLQEDADIARQLQQEEYSRLGTFESAPVSVISERLLGQRQVRQLSPAVDADDFGFLLNSLVGNGSRSIRTASRGGRGRGRGRGRSSRIQRIRNLNDLYENELFHDLFPDRFHAHLDNNDMDMSYEGLLALSEQIGDAIPKGLPRHLISSLPSSIYSKRTEESPECTICLTQFEVGDECKLLPCTHSFHASCIDPWLERSKVCPV